MSEDNLTLSSGYAAAMDAAVHGNHYSIGRRQDQEETTPSDVSERPSVDDVESDTGSTGALETRSLKDHKGKDKKVPLHVKQSRYIKGIYMGFFNQSTGKHSIALYLFIFCLFICLTIVTL